MFCVSSLHWEHWMELVQTPVRHTDSRRRTSPWPEIINLVFLILTPKTFSLHTILLVFQLGYEHIQNVSNHSKIFCLKHLVNLLSVVVWHQKIKEIVSTKDPIKQCAETIRKCLFKLKYDLQDMFCDSNALESATINMIVPENIQIYFSVVQFWDSFAVASKYC